ncbi:hypothetical protein, partial [Pseudomonas sp. GM60]|uniref:hypothetical protein n=1 Tax=Pseudomonas sp. GM60 TaxID=1144334 RepID=UPI0005186790
MTTSSSVGVIQSGNDSPRTPLRHYRLADFAAFVVQAFGGISIVLVMAAGGFALTASHFRKAEGELTLGLM